MLNKSIFELTDTESPLGDWMLDRRKTIALQKNRRLVNYSKPKQYGSSVPSIPNTIPDNIQGYYIRPDGTEIGQVGTSELVKVIDTTHGLETLQKFITNASNGSIWSQNFLSNNGNDLSLNDGSLLTKDELEDIVNAVYTEMGTVATSTVEEAAKIYSTIENRATERNQNELEELATVGNDNNFEIRGWNGRNRTDNTKTCFLPKLQSAYTGVIRAINNATDYSNGAYFWQGTDLSDIGSLAYQEYYENGLNMTVPEYNLWDFEDNPQNNTSNPQVTWDYKYDAIEAQGETTFLKLNETWKDANNYERNL